MISNILAANSYFQVPAAVLVLGLIGLSFLLKLLKAHDYAFNQRSYNKIDRLTELVERNIEITDFLNQLKKCEILKFTTGINTIPAKADLLMNLFAKGSLSQKELKLIYFYIKPENGKVKFKISSFDRVNFLFSLASSMIMFVATVIITFPMILLGEITDTIAGIISFIILLSCIPFLFKEYKGYMILKDLYDELTEENQIVNPELKFGWKYLFFLKGAK